MHSRRIPQHTQYLAASRTQLQFDHRIASQMLVWTARQASQEYVQYVRVRSVYEHFYVYGIRILRVIDTSINRGLAWFSKI